MAVSTELYISFVVGLVLMVIGIANVLKIFQRASWVEGEAKIVDSKVNIETTTHYNLISKSRPTKWVQTKSYTPKLSYEYTVDGNLYLGTNVFSASLGATTPSDILKFTYGSVHPVWYMPSKPHKAYLKQSHKWVSILLIVLGSISIFHASNPNFVPKQFSIIISLMEANL